MEQVEPSNTGLTGSIQALWQWMGKIDGALAAIGATLALLLVLDPAQAGESLLFAGKTLLFLSPYLVLAIALGAYMKASSADVLITRAFRGRASAMIVAAAFFGAWSPLCSCAVIALVAVLLRAGMPLSAVMAFWISSPIISPEMYIYTGALLGFEFASAKMIAAAFMGLLAGFAALGLEKLGQFRTPLRDNSLTQQVPLGEAQRPEWKIWHAPERSQAFRQEFGSIGLLLGKWMFFAFMLESMLMTYVPAEFVGTWVGNANQWAIPLATFLGTPAYVNGIAAVPLVEGLMSKGMTSAAAMGFLLGGSVTSIPAMAAVFPLVRKGVFAGYVLLAMATSLTAALLFHLYLLL